MIVIKTKVTCPKCGQTFDYEFVPGGSFSAIRLGKYRYMKCRKCGKWELFNITENLSETQKHHFGSSALVGGGALVILGGVILWEGIGNRLVSLDLAGILVLAIALVIIGIGLSIQTKNK